MTGRHTSAPMSGPRSSRRGHKYQRVATADLDLERSSPEDHSEDSEIEQEREHRPSSEILDHLRNFKRKNRKSLWIAITMTVGIVLFLYWAVL